MESKTERIAQGIEVIQQENGHVFINLNGHVQFFAQGFDYAVQMLAETHATGRQWNYFSDPLKYVEGATEKL